MSLIPFNKRHSTTMCAKLSNDSKSAEGNLMGVRVPPSAPKQFACIPLFIRVAGFFTFFSKITGFRHLVKKSKKNGVKNGVKIRADNKSCYTTLLSFLLRTFRQYLCICP